MGLPCPNIFAGEHALPFAAGMGSVQDMENAMRTIVHLGDDLGRAGLIRAIFLETL